MSEEEINILKSFANEEDTQYCYDWNGFNYQVILPLLNKLLDLYQKQKEDIMYLRTDAQDLADDVELWQDRCDDSVDKDNIRHKIMELEDKERLLLMSPLEKQYKVQVLNEILEEN